MHDSYVFTGTPSSASDLRVYASSFEHSLNSWDHQARKEHRITASFRLRTFLIAIGAVPESKAR